MALQINPEEMKVKTEAAEELKRETSGGKGDPLSRRIADALIENNENTLKQVNSIDLYTEAVKASCGIAVQAAEDAKEASLLVSNIYGDLKEEMRSATSSAVTEAIPEDVSSLVETAQRGLVESTRKAKAQIDQTSKDASESIRRAQNAADEREKRAKEKSFIASFGRIGKLVCLLLITGTTVLVLLSGWKMMPIVTGEAQITYTEAYQSELDSTKVELIKTKNELEAYKNAYPEGLAEQRLHDLNEKNAQVTAEG